MDMAEAVIDSVEKVTKKWTKQCMSELRHADRIFKRRAAFQKSQRKSLKEAAFEAMEAAYLLASDNGQLPAHARQIFYAARPLVQQKTGRQLEDHYFTQELLPAYIDANPATAGVWNVVYDARGHFQEPHGGKVLPLGTLDVRGYRSQVLKGRVGERLAAGAIPEDRFPTIGPQHRFSRILFVEKEGFLPLFQEVKLAERYDLGIMSTKGLSNVASRRLIDQLQEVRKVTVMVLHDFDKSGFSIFGTLRRDSFRYEFSNLVEVVDLGIRLKDVVAYHLESEQAPNDKSKNPAANLRANGAEPEEIEFLLGGRRVELNAFPSRTLVDWIETRLREHGAVKVVPDAETLRSAYRRSAAAHWVNEGLPDLVAEAEAEAEGVSIPDNLETLVRQQLEQDPSIPWDRAIANLLNNEGL